MKLRWPWVRRVRLDSAIERIVQAEARVEGARVEGFDDGYRMGYLKGQVFILGRVSEMVKERIALEKQKQGESK